MAKLRNPLHWPPGWTDPSRLDWLRDTQINCLLAAPAAIAAKARTLGLETIDADSLPADVVMVKGNWPGLRRSRTGGDAVETWPTGAPWVDSNGWLVRLEMALHPEETVWIAAEPPRDAANMAGRLLAFADAAAYGGRWVIVPGDDRDSIQRIARAAAFFSRHQEWASFQPLAVLAVISDFAGSNRFLSREVLNLTGRLHRPYRILDKSRVTSLEGLKAVIYPDATPPAPELRDMLMRFAGQGGLLITGPQWGAGGDEGEHPRYRVTRHGQGRIAVAKAALTDPYLAANDATTLLSHANDIVRFWNAGAMGSHYTRSADGRRSLVHLINYAGAPGRFPVSVWVKGLFRSARLWTLEDSDSRPLEVRPDRDGVELHLPPIAVYAAVELAD
ncbi:MAG: hypothetical protein HYR60_16595 [Acidobacteria bacterium]|nr:hypothetical protein [Acidobacteriota bacterium]